MSGWSLASVPITGGAATPLAAIDAPGGIQVAGTSVLWDVQEGATVGAIESTSAGVVSPADPVPGSSDPQASLFLADPTAFYWVEC